MTNEKAIQWLRKLVHHDANGKIVPSNESLAKVAREYAGMGDAQLWQLAQAETMIRAAERTGMLEDLA